MERCKNTAVGSSLTALHQQPEGRGAKMSPLLPNPGSLSNHVLPGEDSRKESSHSQSATLYTLQLCPGEANLRPSKKKVFCILLCSSLAMCHVILGSSSRDAHRGYTTLILPACPSLLFHIFSSFPSSKHSIFHPGNWGQDHQLPHPYSLETISRLPVRPCLAHQLFCQAKRGLPWWLRR